MIRKLKRHRAFELSLSVTADDFVAPPRPAQRNWLLNRAVEEWAADLAALDRAAARFVPGQEAVHVDARATRALADDEIMEDWQVPLMRAMARVAAERHGDVLEIGFGRGVASGFLQAEGVTSHTIVECNPSVIARFDAWRAGYPGRDLRMVEGLWQDVIDGLGQFDGIFFHTFPLSEEEYLATVVQSVTFAEHFFQAAAAHLRPGGTFTYLTNEIDSLGREHQRRLLEHFARVTLEVLPLAVPPDTRDTIWADRMVVVKAER